MSMTLSAVGSTPTFHAPAKTCSNFKQKIQQIALRDAMIGVAYALIAMSISLLATMLIIGLKAHLRASLLIAFGTIIGIASAILSLLVILWLQRTVFAETTTKNN